MGVQVGGRLLGGLLQGFGTGLLDQAKDDRARALEQLRIEAASKNLQAELTSHEKVAGQEIGSREKIAGNEQQTQKDVAGINQTGAMQRTQAEIDANAPLKAAETKYYTDTKGKPVMADQDGFAMQQGPDGNWTYQTDADGNKVKLNKAGGSARNPEGVVGAIADDLQKADPNLSRADALEKARSGKGAQVELSKERLAQGAWKTDADPSGNPKHTLDYWRQQYGLPPMATNAPAPIPSASASPSPSPTPSAVTQPAKTAAAPAPAAPGAAMAAEPAAPSSSQDAVGTQTNPAKPMSQDDFNALPSGSWFVNPADKRLLRKK